MNPNHLRVNRSFMLMNAILAFALFAIVLLFLYISFRFQRKADKRETFADVYVVALDASLSGDSLSVYLNDSLLLRRTVPAEGLTDTVTRFSADNALMIVAHDRDDRVTPFNLPDEPAVIRVTRGENDGIDIFIRE